MNDPKRKLPHVVIHTDGGSSGNPGPAGWAAILRYSRHEKELKGGEARATNNQMELTAAIVALETLKFSCSVDLYSDSQLLIKGITEWINAWKRNDWHNSKREPVINRKLWERLDGARKRHTVRWHWVRGHAGHAQNERADALVQEAIAEIRSVKGGATD